MSAQIKAALADFRLLRSRVESDADEDLTVELSEQLNRVGEALESAAARAMVLEQALAPAPRVNGGLVALEHSREALEELLIECKLARAKEKTEAQREAVAWQTIDSWREDDRYAIADFSLASDSDEDTWQVTFTVMLLTGECGTQKLRPEPFRLEALEAAAKWCRAELGK